MNLDIKIRKIKCKDNLSFKIPVSSNYIYIHQYKNNEYYLLYKYKYKFSIEFNIITNSIKFNYCSLYKNPKYCLEIATASNNKISKYIRLGDNFYNYIYNVDSKYELMKNTYNIYLLYKYLLSINYFNKYNNMRENILNTKKFNCMKNYKIIIYIVDAI